MVIQRDAWSIGALSSSDQNAQSFHSPNWKHSRGKRSSHQEFIVVEDDVVTIGSHPPHPLKPTTANLGLINAITFSQTQDGFLGKVQEALRRMNELSVMAQDEAHSEAERQTYKVEFTQLQNRIREIENKMFKAMNLFQPGDTETGNRRHQPEAADSLRTVQLNECLENTSDPELTTINNAKDASAAVDTIHHALETVADLRAKVSVDIQRLNSTDEELSAMDISPDRADLEIRDVNVAEESTRFLRHDILRKSGTAMLAQANAIPQSALRLLG
jgi:flagellin